MRLGQDDHDIRGGATFGRDPSIYLVYPPLAIRGDYKEASIVDGGNVPAGPSQQHHIVACFRQSAGKG
jgi:hypothetical protein